MKKHILVELSKTTNQLGQIEGFIWDDSYEPIPMSNRGEKETYVYRGTVIHEQAIQSIESLPHFYAIWDDALIGPAGGFGLAVCDIQITNLVVGTIEEGSEKGEFELFLLHHKQKGKKTEIYDKWVAKMDEKKEIAKPVYQKLIREFGNEFELKKTKEVMKIYETIMDKSRIKVFE